MIIITACLLKLSSSSGGTEYSSFLKLNSVRTLERGILQHLSLSGAIVIVKKL